MTLQRSGAFALLALASLLLFVAAPARAKGLVERPTGAGPPDDGDRRIKWCRKWCRPIAG